MCGFLTVHVCGEYDPYQSSMDLHDLWKKRKLQHTDPPYCRIITPAAGSQSRAVRMCWHEQMKCCATHQEQGF